MLIKAQKVYIRPKSAATESKNQGVGKSRAISDSPYMTDPHSTPNLIGSLILENWSPLPLKCKLLCFGSNCMEELHESTRTTDEIGEKMDRLSACKPGCQTCLENTHWVSRWYVVSSSCKHREHGQRTAYRPRRTLRPEVQIPCWPSAASDGSRRRPTAQSPSP